MSGAAETRSSSVPLAAAKATHVRWIVCSILFAAVVLSYIDRQVLSVLKPTLQKAYGWSETGYGDVVFWFQVAYGAGYIAFGRLIDKVGAKVGYVVAVALWTVGHMAHALVTSTLGFALVRIPLALGEAGTYPSALAAAAEWFPRHERALAIGTFNAGANMGAIVTPLIVPAIALTLGWRWAFVITGLFTVVWLAAWLAYYRRPRQHPQVNAAELAIIEADPIAPQRPVAWRRLFGLRATWAYMAGRFLIDPFWWTFLFWLPDFFAKRFGVDMKGYGPPLIVIYVTADLGSIAGGWTSSRLLRHGVTPNRARKLAMLGAALLVTPVAFASQTSNEWIAVGLIALACAGHQGFSTNLFALPSDLFPMWAAGSIVGLGGAAGALGSMLIAKYAGWVLQTFGSYTPIFAMAGGAYLLALVVVHLIVPAYRPVDPARLGAREGRV
jgi:ACS family hexuronate transporter-like MFS transporter